ncbi:MAG: hypothetical protein IJB74_09095 [Clostridia bacterium]|nr:hypothetical protein [Clostridia bacterium]
MSELYGGLSALKDGTFTFDEVLLYYTDMPLSAFVFETMINKKKEGKNMARIMNQPTVDLRGFTPEALRKIKSITNVATVILPEDMPDGFSEAYMQIKKMNIAGEIRVPDSAQFFNGDVTLTRNDVTNDSVIMCNGMAFVSDIPEDMNVRMIINGTLIKSESAFITVTSINGTKVEVSDDVKPVKGKAQLTFDKNFADNIEKKTILVACGKIYISDDVTEEMLSEKQVKFVSVGKIIARRELHGYIQANSDAVGKVLTAEKAKKTEKKKLFRWK